MEAGPVDVLVGTQRIATSGNAGVKKRNFCLKWERPSQPVSRAL